MNRLKRKLAVNGIVSTLSIIIILSMVAAPAVAYISANQVVSSSIKDGQVKTQDLAVGAVGTGRIKNGAVTGAKIRNYTITKEDIHSGSINKYKLTSGAVNSFKIEDGSILNRDIANGAIDSAKVANGSITASKINSTGLNADTLDGKDSSNFSDTTHDHDADYYTQAIADAMFAQLGHDHDLRYYTRKAAEAAFATLNHEHDSAYATRGHHHNRDYVNDGAGEVDSVDIADGSVTNRDIAANAAISDSKISYSTKTGYLSLSPADFMPDGTSDVDITQGMIRSGSSNAEYALAPVHLPHGAIVTKISVDYYDYSTYDGFVKLFFSDSDPGQSGEMASVSTSGASIQWRTVDETTIDSTPIDNEFHSYYIRARVWGPEAVEANSREVAISQVRITYTYSSPGG